MNRPLNTPWVDRITKLEPAAVFAPPATEAQLIAAEGRLNNAIPAQLRSLLSESNGVDGEYGLGLVWSIDRIVSENEHLRSNAPLSHAMPLDSLLFFGDGGNGEPFGHPIGRDGVTGDGVYVWNPIDDSRNWVAQSLADYLTRWLNGSLTI